MAERLWRKMSDASFWMIDAGVAWPWVRPVFRLPRKACAAAASWLWRRQARKVLREAGKL
jgi:hypothetical protein